ncbi:MAG: hypothetical protein ACM3VT_03235 [Solirubrobacterales bacterium]
MKVEQIYRQARFGLDARPAKIVGGSGHPRSVFTHLRGLCIIRLVGLLVFAGTASLQADEARTNAKNSGAGSSSGYVAGPIRDPMNPQAYMSQIASKLNTADGRGVLLKGMNAPAAKRVEPPKAQTPAAAATTPAKAPAVTPAPVSVAPTTPGIVPNVSSPTVPILVPRVAPAAVPVIASAASVVPQAAPSPAPTPVVAEKRVPILSTLPPAAPEPKNVPAPQVVSATVWNGLSVENGAAQKAMEQMEALRAKTAQQNKAKTPAGTTAVAKGAKSAAKTTAVAAAKPVQPLNQTLQTAKPGLTLWTKSSPANLAETVAIDSSVAADPNLANLDPNALVTAAAAQENKPWSVGEDLDKYRAHAVKEGGRNSGESLKKALETAGVTVGDGVNVFILGYGSEKAKALRVNDGKGLLDEPNKVPVQAGKTVVSLADSVYSLADLITFDALPDPIKGVYKDNNPLVRPLIFTGRTIGGVWKTTEEVGNAVTWGYFDNVTGCVGFVIEDILELFKHVGQAATNLARLPVELVAGKKEGTERVMDWVLLVPLEFVSNSVEMKGIANMDAYKAAFEDKGVIGSVLEFGGSTFLVYRAVDEIIDELKDDDHHHHSGNESEDPEVPIDDNTTDPIVTPTNPTGSDMLFIIDGEWPTISADGGIILFEGDVPAITVLIE